MTRRLGGRKLIAFANVLGAQQGRHPVVITDASLRDIVKMMPAFKDVIHIPIELDETAVKPAGAKPSLSELDGKFREATNKFVFNMDESGSSEGSDSWDMRSVRSNDDPERSFSLTLNRNAKTSPPPKTNEDRFVASGLTCSPHLRKRTTFGSDTWDMRARR
jgi:hypothetical protein